MKLEINKFLTGGLIVALLLMTTFAIAGNSDRAGEAGAGT